MMCPHRPPATVALFLATCLAAGVCPGTASAAEGLTRVVVDPGHGGRNKGAPDPHRENSWEKYHTLEIGLRVAERLRKAGVEVVLTREDDTYVSLADRVKLANDVRADVLISIHLNSTERPGPSGHETFFLSLDATDEAAAKLAAYENADEGGGATAPPEPADDGVQAILMDLAQTQAHADAERLAAIVQERMAPIHKFKNRGVKQAPFSVLMGAAMPAVVIEVGFLNHKKEGRWITSAEGIAKISDAIADAVLDFGRVVNAPRAKRPGDEAPATPTAPTPPDSKATTAPTTNPPKPATP